MENELLSLFCGAGGLDRGFQQAGFKTVLALDKCTNAVRTFNLNSSQPVAQVADLSALKPAAFLDMVPSSSRPIGLIGGPPCQGFSRGNVCADPSDARNLLPFRYAALLAAANRKFDLHFFVFENVVGLAGPKHAHRFSRILSRLRAAGFNIFHEQLNASDFAVPQRRKRLFLVGLNAKHYPQHRFVFPSGSEKHLTVSDAIRGLPAPIFFERSLAPDAIPFHPNHWAMVPKSAKFNSGHSTDGRSFKRLRWDDVSPTVAYGNREVHVHPDGTRRLSIFEAMLLQGFPHDYTLTGSLSAQVTQVSNAVPPPLARAIAQSLRVLVSARSRPAHRSTSTPTSAGRHSSQHVQTRDRR